MQQISPDNVASKISSLLGDGVGNIAKLAVVILVEQKKGQVHASLVPSLVSITLNRG